MNEEHIPFDDFNVIYTYTTQDALDDGILVDAATHQDLSYVTLLNWNTERIRIIVSSGLLAVLQEAGNIMADWQRLNDLFIQTHRNRSCHFAELKLQIGGIHFTIWVGCEPFDADDTTPKITFYLPEEH